MEMNGPENNQEPEFKPFENPSSIRTDYKGPVVPMERSETVSFARAFRVLVNYWEMKPTQYEQKLSELALQDVTTVTALVPWNHAESDIYHSLKKFLRAAYNTNLKVKLYVMPELGLNYPNVGIPRDLLNNNANLATDRKGNVIYNHTAPNIFPLPSFFAPEVLKRFGNFLIKVAGILGELSQELHHSDFCDLVVTNSFFNYYRSHGLPFSEHGDYSAAHVMAFREFLDKEYPGATGEPFKRQIYETHNRHRFIAHVERNLREKTEMIFSRKNSRFRLVHGDMLNPECAPDTAYQALLCEVFDFKPSVTQFYHEISDAVARRENIYFNNSGVFRRFSEQEKSFLMLASLIHTGEVTVGHEELARFSDSFKRKLSGLLSVIQSKDYFLARKLRYISASKFSALPESLELLQTHANGVYSLEAGISPYTDAKQAYHERLVIIDPQYIIRQVDLLQAISLAQAGKVVVIPAPSSQVPNYLAEAVSHYEKFKKGRQPLKFNLGFNYEVFDYQLGKIVFYECDQMWTQRPDKTKLEMFMRSMMGLADIQSVCRLNDSRLQIVCHVSSHDPSDKLMFLVNPTSEAIVAKLSFEKNVGLVGIPRKEDHEMIVGQSFELNVPPLGMLSMSLVENLPADLANRSEATVWN